ncbi:thiamine diphosphokinase [Rhodobacter calidifons]|uniref:Thiamine diphosphokinase n=1 Tax=Rhodobacter calidifons TaxID=2715277 RepID=A0ABX0G2Q7_9RHOB|nr:thiamine diphosphokinase [Rhodobacter calidifons]NHB75225.1 thiamine diphosphokinase [Rhodobacter calidifons]
MNSPIVQSTHGVTLAGGGPIPARDLALALARAPVAVAADGGADRLLQLGVMPEAVIGDMDSISPAARRAVPAARQHLVAEQVTTDFDKALRLIAAPLVLALGFAGARMDHGLAAFATLIAQAHRRCILLGPKDFAFAAPPRLTMDLRPGEPLSLFPMAPVTGQSEGLEWPISGIDFAPDGMIGTSNRVTAPRVVLEFDRPGMLVILPRRRLDAAIRALRSTP